VGRLPDQLAKLIERPDDDGLVPMVGDELKPARRAGLKRADAVVADRTSAFDVDTLGADAVRFDTDLADDLEEGSERDRSAPVIRSILKLSVEHRQSPFAGRVE
jgi:hypothetical protein